MGFTKVNEATIIILDIGRNVSAAEDKTGKSFFDEAIKCTARIIERKILSQGQNYLGIILLGSKKTNNSMADQCEGAYQRIELFAPLQKPTWQMIRDLPNTPTKAKGDWFDSIVVAADHFKNGISGVKISKKKIIVMTNFVAQTYAEPTDIEHVLEGLRDDEFTVSVFGPDIYSDTSKGTDMELARKFVEVTNGETATFEFAMGYLTFHKKQAINSMPWNVDLSIGPNIKIPVSSFIRIKDQPLLERWKKAIKDINTSKASQTEGIAKHKVHVNTEDESVVQANEIIKGYHYGQQVIPFSECDKSMLYDPGVKSLSVYGFTPSKNIKWQNLNGDGLSYVFGRKGDKKAQYAIRCLVMCLHELDLVGIVRRVYNNGNAPKMFALMPVIDSNDFVCLSMIEVSFKENIKYMSFPPTHLKKYECTEKQVDAFKDLIKAMDLTNAYEESEYDDTEAFPIAETVSPSPQYVLDCIAYRAMNPGKPLPPPRDEIMMLFKVPPLIEKRMNDPIDNLKKILILNKVEVKTSNRKRKLDTLDDSNELFKKPFSCQDVSKEEEAMPKIELHNISKEKKILKIGTLNPIHDFEELKSNGRSLNDLATEMCAAIEKMIYANINEDYSKSLAAMTHLRKEMVKSDPSIYNSWFKKFKSELLDRKMHIIINLINEQKLDIILKTENSLSNFDSNEDSQLYENDTVPDDTSEMTINSEINNLFDGL